MRNLVASATDTFLEPISIMVDLLRAKRLQVGDLSLSSAVEVFARYVNNGRGDSFEPIGEFANSFSVLLAAKSRLLVPQIKDVWENTDEMERLDQVTLPGKPAQLIEVLNERWQLGYESFARHEHVPSPTPHVLLASIPPMRVFDAWNRQVNEYNLRRTKPVTAMVFMRIERATRSIRATITRFRQLSFFDLIQENQLDSKDAVVYFLALLDMTKNGDVSAQQDRPFGDIILKPKALGTSPRVASEANLL